MTTIEKRIQEIEEKFRQLGYWIEPSLGSLDEDLDAIFSLETNELIDDSQMTDELATLATEWAEAVRAKNSASQEASRDAHEATSDEQWNATDQVKFGRDNQISVQAFAGLYRYSGLGTGKYFSRDGCAYWIDPVQASQKADAEGSHYVYWDCERSAPTLTLTSKYVSNYTASLEASIKMIASEARIAASGERRFGDPPGTDRVKNIMALCASALAKMDMKSRCEHLVMGEKAKNREEAKLMVHHLAEKHGIVLSDWKPSAAIEWEYCDGHIGGSSDVTLRIGASTGGTVQLNGDPYTPDRRFANDCIESLSVSLQPHLMRMSLRQEIKRVVVEEPGNSFSASRLFVQMREAGFSPDWRNRQDEQETHYAITLPSSEVAAYRSGIGRQMTQGSPSEVMLTTVDAFMEKNILAKADWREPPQDDDAFDFYMANEHFHKIERVEVMENFLLRAARRFHVLDAEQSAAINADQTLPAVKQKAWEFLYDQFSNSMSDLRMFFSETGDYYEQSPEERKRLKAVADALVCSAKDVTKIEQAERLGAMAVAVESAGETNLAASMPMAPRSDDSSLEP